MRVLALLSMLSCVAAFTFAPQSSFGRANTVRMNIGDEDRSIAIPFDKRPPALDGSMAGDVGFDPAGFSNNPPRPWLIGGEGRSLKWYREAEIVHGRVAMIAALGCVFPYIAHFPGNEDVGVNAFANTDPLSALSSVPPGGLWQIAALTFAIEYYRIQRVIKGDAEPGDMGWGQGEGRWNPFGFKYTEEEYFEKQTQEIKNGRLAMVGILGLLSQSAVTHMGLFSQFDGIFNTPEAVMKAGYYFPEGI